jgi:hypothetical protein
VRGTHTRAACAGGAVAALVLSSSPANAAPTARLVYSRTSDAASCPDESALRQAVASRVGYDAFFPWAPRTVVVAVVRHEAAFVALVDLVDEGGIDHGAHELHTQGACSDLLDAVALAVAIAIDPRNAMATPGAKVDSAPPPAETPAPAIVPPPVSIPIPEPSPAAQPMPQAPDVPPAAGSTTRRLVFEASVGGGLALGMAPEPALNGTLGVALRVSWFSIGLEGLIDTPESAPAKLGSGQVSTWPLIFGLVPCGSVGPVFACAVAQAGRLQSSAEGPGTVSKSSVWGAFGGRIGVMFPVAGPLFLRVRADLLGDVSPSNLELNGHSAWTAPYVAGTLGIDAVVRF